MENEELLQRLRSSEYIREVSFGDVSSFNFTKKAFYNGVWNSLTTKARGLFINTKTGRIVSRSYDKFFNYEERAETSDKSLARNLQFPVVAYKKENGFLGMISYDEEIDSFRFASKSNIGGEFANRLARIFYAQHDVLLGRLLYLLKLHDFTMVVEVIDPVEDPHIIEYSEAKIIVLDFVYNTPNFSHVSYQTLCDICEAVGLEHKQLMHRFNDWKVLSRTMHEWDKETYTSTGGKPIEGFVLCDANGFMFKYKTGYYRLWKLRRGAVDKIIHGKPPLEWYKTDPFIVWFTNSLEAGVVNGTEDIISLRRKYEHG